MVRATLISLWNPRAEIPDCSPARSSVSRASGESHAAFPRSRAERDAFSFRFYDAPLACGAPSCTRVRTAAEPSAFSSAERRFVSTRPTDTHISMRSITGPESLRAYFAKDCCEQSHVFSEPRFPHGHGLNAAMSMISAGNTSVPFAREMVTSRSSSGWRSDSMTRDSNSGTHPEKVLLYAQA